MDVLCIGILFRLFSFHLLLLRTQLNDFYSRYFDDYLSRIKSEGRYRYFANLSRIVGDFPNAIYTDAEGRKKKVQIWCGNDYLGMGEHPSVMAAARQALEQNGTGAGGTRNISGTTAHHLALEESVADLHKKEAGLIFSSGYTANVGALHTLGRLMPSCAIFSDELNHASMIAGINSCKAEKFIFRHNDMAHLESLLQKVELQRPKLIAFESVYSMEGDRGPILEVISLAKKYNAMTYLDEVHAVGLYGPRGGGVAEELDVLDEIDIIEGTFGKCYGSVGGFITGTRIVIDAIRSHAPNFIFTTSLPPASLAASLASVEHLKTSHTERTKLRKNVALLKELISAAGLPFYDGNTHIVPLIVGEPNCCRELTNLLLQDYHYYVQPINYPTVPKGTERLRLTASAAHNTSDIENFVAVLEEIWTEHHLTFLQQKKA